ncbi:MAG: prolyl oligopeptidase family serine peptidase [Pseudohongiellaceae bacterium]
MIPIAIHKHSSSALALALIALLLSPGALADREPADDERMIDDPRVQHRSYTFAPTGEEIPYALFVPESYDPQSPAPLIVSLHGLGRSYDWLMGYHGFLDFAEAGGHIVVTPLGYIRRGWYGAETLADADDGRYSEQDVMEVLGLVRAEFNVDANRIYLWGHSMGGAGTYHLAKRHPDLFAALAVVAPAPRDSQSPDDLIVFQHLPILVMHGDDDQTVPVDVSHLWVARMQELGMQHLYIEVSGGDHSLLISQTPDNMQKVVDFFNITRKDY